MTAMAFMIIGALLIMLLLLALLGPEDDRGEADRPYYGTGDVTRHASRPNIRKEQL